MVKIATPVTSSDLDEYRDLVREYARSAVFKVNWTKLEKDLSGLPSGFSAPDGAMLLARADGKPIGCVALRRFDESQGEMKRLYVRPAGRSLGIGEKLATMVAGEAKRLGFRAVLLDTYERTPNAIRLYQRLGYDEIPAYCYNPEPDTRYFRLVLGSLPEVDQGADDTGVPANKDYRGTQHQNEW